MTLLVLLAIAALGLVALIIKRIRAGPAPSIKGLPVMPLQEGVTCDELVRLGFEKYRDAPFVIPMEPPYVILPMSLYTEATRAPESQISFDQVVHDAFQTNHTLLNFNTQIKTSVRQDLNQNLPNILPLIMDEAEYAFNEGIGKPENWTRIRIYDTLLRVIAHLTGRIFVGLPLSRNEEWLKMSINYTLSLSNVATETESWNKTVLSLLAPLLPVVRRARGHVDRATAWMKPFVDNVMSEKLDLGNGKMGVAVSAEGKGTFIQWVLNRVPRSMATAHFLGVAQMSISFAAIHTTGMASYQALVDLCTNPSYIKPLRDEVTQVLAEEDAGVDENGQPVITKAAFAKMKLLDSFIKESQRLNPISSLASERRLGTDYTFSTGLRLPKGVAIGFPMTAVYNSTKTPSFDPELSNAVGNASLDVFDAYRFARLRELPGHEMKHQTVSTNGDSLNFGQGSHACPGRFFAIYEVKLIIVYFLLNYDCRLEGDVAGKGGIRPPNLLSGFRIRPDPSLVLEVRRRQE